MRVECLHSSTTPRTFSPSQLLTAFNPDSSSELSAGTSDFQYCKQGENETHSHAEVCPGGYTAFIYKARRTLFRSPPFLLFCSRQRIAVLCEGESLVQPMSAATGIGQHSNISHGLFADCGTEVLSPGSLATLLSSHANCHIRKAAPGRALLEMCRSECPVGHLVILILQYFSIRPHLDLALQHPQCWWKARSAGLLPTSQAHHVIRIWNRGRLGPFTPTIFSVCLQD